LLPAWSRVDDLECPEISVASPSAIIDRPDLELASACGGERRAFVGGTFWWNYPIARGLFTVPTGPPVFCATIDEAIAAARRNGGRVIAWAARLEPRHEQECGALDLDLVRIEDGFIRSIGLGAGFAGAASLAVDLRGIYYDPNRSSDIEHLLQSSALSDADRENGARIRRRIVELRLSKYNLHRGKPLEVRAGARKIILVPGQVADDASVLNSLSRTIDPRSRESVNLQLLRLARARNPDAYLIFKPHPDVRYGLRSGHIPSDEARKLADLVVHDVDIVHLIELCDGVETISSLAGFEALLRGKSVTVHGLPFYAGWGLTTDLAHTPRRTTRRTIDELCHIALARYTRHVDPVTGRSCSIHELLDALDALRASRWHRYRVAGLRRYAQLCEFLAANSEKSRKI
jgi:capsular polysaccharide export protein